MASLDDKIQQTVSLLEKGQYDRAAKLSRAVLLHRPNATDALHLLAVACFRLGDSDAAVRYAERAVRLRPDSVDYASNLGRYYISLGRLDEAVTILSRAAAIAPDHAVVHYNLAQVVKQQGRADEAVTRLRSFIERHPNDPIALTQYGVLLTELGQHDQALVAFEKALELNPGSAEAHMNVGSTLQALGRPSDALPHHIRAIELSPDNVDVMTGLGSTMQALGQLDDAEQWLRAALQRHPRHHNARANFALLMAARRRFDEAATLLARLAAENPHQFETWNNLGNSLMELARYDEAVQAFEQAIAARPAFFEAFTNIGNVYRRQGKLEQSLTYCDRALAVNPQFPEGLNNKGVTLLELGRLDEAAACFERAAEVRPGFADPLVNLANVWRNRGQLHKAVAILRQAFAHAPGNASIANNLGCALGDLGQVAEALHCYRQAFQLEPHNHYAHSNVLLNLHYIPDITPEQIWLEHRHFARVHEPTAAALRHPHTNIADPNRPLRIGYVSADFRRHSVAFFLEPLIERHTQSAFEPYCYSTVLLPDPVTEKFRSSVGNRWRNILGYSTQQIAEQVRADGIDILVDLGGHTGNNRLMAFAAKPAPVQVTWLGYPNTTGLTAMDYRITDRVADPVGSTDHWHSEALVRLDRPFLCYRPAPTTPAVAVSPVTEGKPFTFGSFNAMSKISTQTVRMWSTILLRVPGSRLILKNKGLHEPESRELFYRRFAECGVGAERLLIQGQVPTLESHLDLYRFMDLALDTFPYHGTTTTCEALWMGVPVLTLAGRAHVARVGCSLLASVGLNNFVAETADEYIETAVQLATGWREWAQLRTSLRDRLRESSLLDERGFVQSMELAYREMWRRWCFKGAESC